MTKPPNNFPREGQHDTVTRSHIRKLESERDKRNATLEYTIGGTTEAHVHSCVAAEREAAITQGSRRLRQASAKLRQAHVESVHQGRAKAQFNQAKDPSRAAYIRAQQRQAEQARQKQRARIVKRTY